MFWNYLEIKDLFTLSTMNLKHEMFWNFTKWSAGFLEAIMNLKHEMFWNRLPNIINTLLFFIWTLNMKCFEIQKTKIYLAMILYEP